MQALYALAASVKTGGVPSRTLDLVHLRASQAGETDERLFAVAASGRRLTLKVFFSRLDADIHDLSPLLVHRLCFRGAVDLLVRAAGFRSSLL
jgi:hypothetical protein